MAGNMTSIRIILSTLENAEKAGELAEKLVSDRLAACVNIVPSIRSIYRWEGKLCNDNECLMILKTSEERVRELMTRLKELHPYDLPEIVAIKPDSVLDAYQSWVVAETTK